MVFPAFVEICILFNGHDPLDACLNNRASAVHARRVGDEDRATFKRNADSRGIRDCIEFGVTEPKVLLRPFGAPGVSQLVRTTTPRSAVVSTRPVFSCRADDDCADFGRGVFAELRAGIGESHEFVVFCHFSTPHEWG